MFNQNFKGKIKEHFGNLTKSYTKYVCNLQNGNHNNSFHNYFKMNHTAWNKLKTTN